MRTIDALLKTNYRGEYSPEEMYKKMDVVTNGHDAFLVLIDNRGHNLRNTEYFMALSKGDKGDPGTNGKSAYDLAVEYEGPRHHATSVQVMYTSLTRTVMVG